MEIQRKYWESWTNMSTQALGLSKPAAPPWENAMDHWWKGVSGGMPAFGQDFMTKMMDQGKVFFRLAENLTQNLEGGDWSHALEKTMADMQRAFGLSPQQPGDDSMHKMLAFWEMPFDNWQRMVSSLSLVPGDLLRNMPHDQARDNLHRFLSAPGLGYSREEQAQYQDLMRRATAYQRATQEYMQFFSSLGIQALDRMREKLTELSKQGKAVNSARGLYDLWVGSCEDVYGEQVATVEHARVHGQLVNALIAVKQRLSIMVDETLGTLNMPTRAELRTLQDRVQETRRENKALRAELEAMKEQLAALGAGASGTVKAPARRTASKAAADSSQT